MSSPIGIFQQQLLHHVMSRLDCGSSAWSLFRFPLSSRCSTLGTKSAAPSDGAIWRSPPILVSPLLDAGVRGRLQEAQEIFGDVGGLLEAYAQRRRVQSGGGGREGSDEDEDDDGLDEEAFEGDVDALAAHQDAREAKMAARAEKRARAQASPPSHCGSVSRGAQVKGTIRRSAAQCRGQQRAEQMLVHRCWVRWWSYV